MGFNLVNAQTQSLLTKKYGPDQLKQDAIVMRDAIMRIHPVVGIYESRAYYDKLFNDHINSLTDSLTEKQFRIKTKLVVERLHCGHTDIMYSKNYLKTLKKTKFNFPRYYLVPIDDKVYVLGGLNRKLDTLLKPGTLITKINGVPADSFYRFAQSLITIDGYINESKKLYGQMGYSSYYLTLLNYPDTIQYEYVRNGKTQVLKSAAFNAINIPDFSWRKKDDTLFTKYKRAKMRYRYMDEDKKTMHLNIQAFSQRKYTKAYRKIFKQLQKNKTENLIIDLRYNGGGSLTNSTLLLKYLLNEPVKQTSYTTIRKYPFKKYTKGNAVFRITRLYFKLYSKQRRSGDTTFFTMKVKPSKKYHYNNKVYVLTNGGSFSASCLVGAYLKETGRATFIGRETGGTIEGCNAVITAYYKLPNTKTKVRVPTFRLLHDVYTKGNTGHGIIPDHETNYTFKDIFYKKDLEMEKVMELIKKK
ncbi:MAG: hypothetical protein IPI93_01995 [Sphingobacteriaceae bacterium]|nr:hypothetical protein [Sphingobacteriaceae bacterium]